MKTQNIGVVVSKKTLNNVMNTAVMKMGLILLVFIGTIGIGIGLVRALSGNEDQIQGLAWIGGTGVVLLFIVLWFVAINIEVD